MLPTEEAYREALTAIGILTVENRILRQRLREAPQVEVVEESPSTAEEADSEIPK